MSWHDHRGFVDSKDTNISKANCFEFTIGSDVKDIVISSMSIDIPDNVTSNTVLELRDTNNDFHIYSEFHVNQNIHASEENYVPTIVNKVVSTIFLRQGQSLVIKSNNPDVVVRYTSQEE